MKRLILLIFIHLTFFEEEELEFDIKKITMHACRWMISTGTGGVEISPIILLHYLQYDTT